MKPTWNPPPDKQVYACYECKDMGWVYPATAATAGPEEIGRMKPLRCRCQTEHDTLRRRRYLEQIDGLTVSERSRTWQFLEVGLNGDVMSFVQNAVQRRRGLITLTGAPGTGKTTMLHCAVNQARTINVTTAYTTVTDLLDYLRNAYNPNSQRDLTFDGRWEMLVNVEVLALDEADEFNATSWALERFLRLVDERWRNIDRRLTIFAMNGDADHLPEKVASRLSDGRANRFTLQSLVDLRTTQSW